MYQLNVNHIGTILDPLRPLLSKVDVSSKLSPILEKTSKINCNLFHSDMSTSAAEYLISWHNRDFLEEAPSQRFNNIYPFL